MLTTKVTAVGDVDRTNGVLWQSRNKKAGGCPQTF